MTPLPPYSYDVPEAREYAMRGCLAMAAIVFCILLAGVYGIVVLVLR